MAVVVADTTPLHYLILVGKEHILEKLYGQVFIPPAVLAELTHSAAPVEVSQWAMSPPGWLIVAAPKSFAKTPAGLDFGEAQALALAAEIHADLILLDDKVARRAAARESIRVKGTLGVVADAARLHLLDFAATIKELQKTSMHLDQEIVDMITAEYERSKQ